jgi:hypothetical protein
MNARIRKKWAKQGKLPSAPPKAAWKDRFPFERRAVERYAALREADPTNPLLAYGTVSEDGHFQPSTAHWEVREQTGIFRYHLTPRNEDCSWSSYLLRLGLAVNKLEGARA